MMQIGNGKGGGGGGTAAATAVGGSRGTSHGGSVSAMGGMSHQPPNRRMESTGPKKIKPYIEYEL